MLGKLPQLFSFVSATPTPVSAPSVAACKPMHSANKSESESVPKKKESGSPARVVINTHSPPPTDARAAVGEGGVAAVG